MKHVPGIMDFTLRVFVLILCLTVGVFFLFAGAKAALAASLKPVTVLEDDVLTVGDLFDGLKSEKATYILGPAPVPGQDMVLNARTLMQISRALDLPWQPQSTNDQIVVRRAATLINDIAITNEIKNFVQIEGVNSEFEISYYGGSNPEIILPHNTPPTFAIANMHYDHQRDLFEATIVAPSMENPLVETVVAGKIKRIVKMPVLSESLRNGDVISERDINWVNVYEEELQYDYILDEDKIIGMTPRRIVTAGKPMRDTELQRPQMVARGDFVTIIYESGPMSLSAKGKAMQNGAKGDFVRVVNTNSNRSIEAIITADREVKIYQ